jgi:integrase
MTRSRQGNGRSTIYKGGDGRWHGRVTVGLTDQGRTDRRHVASTSKSKVVERVKALEQARDRGQLGNLSKPWTVESWLEYWLENVSRPFVKRSTYEGYRAAVRVHLIPGIGRHRLASLRPEHLERLYVAMLKIQTWRGTVMSPGRVHQVHRTIRTALNEAVRRGHLDRNPAELAKTPPIIEHEVEPYSVLEVQQLIEAAKRERNGVTWVVALVLGFRQGEALGLKWDDIDWMTGLLSVKRSRTRPRYEHGCQPNCGHKYAGHCPARQNVRPPTDTTKSRAGKRIVPPARRDRRPAAGSQRISVSGTTESRSTLVRRELDLCRRDWSGRQSPNRLGRLEASTCIRRRPRRAPPRCTSHRSYRSSAARRARAHNHERSGLVNHRDG